MRSAAACTMCMGCRTIITSIGASAAVVTSFDDEPMCMQTIVPSSEHACQNGSQWSECRLGSPSGSGFSGNVTAWQPFLATRWISSASVSGSQIVGTASGMNRPGCVPHHSSMCQSLYACARASAAFLSSRAANSRPANPGSDGKLREPITPLAFMSRMRFSMSKHPSRISAKLVGSIPYSSGGRPATALSPMFGTSNSRNCHTSVPSSLWMTLGATSRYLAGRWRSNRSGGSTTWSSTPTMIMSSVFMRFSVPSGREGVASATMTGVPQTVVLDVRGMLRASEKSVVDVVLGRRPGVLSVDANPVAQAATVTFDPSQTSVEELRDWVRDCGYHCAGQSVPNHVCDPLLEPGAPTEPPMDHAAMAGDRDGDHDDMSMASMVTDMRNRFFVAALFSIPIVLWS